MHYVNYYYSAHSKNYYMKLYVVKSLIQPTVMATSKNPKYSYVLSYKLSLKSVRKIGFGN